MKDGLPIGFTATGIAGIVFGIDGRFGCEDPTDRLIPSVTGENGTGRRAEFLRRYPKEIFEVPRKYRR